MSTSGRHPSLCICGASAPIRNVWRSSLYYLFPFVLGYLASGLGILGGDPAPGIAVKCMGLKENRVALVFSNVDTSAIKRERTFQLHI